MPTLTKETKAEIRARIMKGQKALDATRKDLFKDWTNARTIETKRTVSSFTKADLIAAYAFIASLYREQKTATAEHDFDWNTMTLRERTLHRAASIRKVLAAAKAEAIASGRTVKAKLGTLRN